ncbi:MAG: hypothetical protein J6Y02_14710 [Pseudobutyrivibrio sp.]|nr:hypothetical protein [Pseudobutyrivibrio sp.]
MSISNPMFKFKTIMQSILMHGVDLDKVDWAGGIVYLAIPKNGYMYEGTEPNALKSPEQLASRIKDMMIKSGFTNTKVRFRIKDIYFPKSEADNYYNQNREKVCHIIDAAIRKARDGYNEP